MPNVREGGCFHSSPGAPSSSWLHSGCGSPRDPCAFFNAEPFSAQGSGGAAGPKGDQVSDRWSGQLWAACCLQGWGASFSSLPSPSLSRHPHHHQADNSGHPAGPGTSWLLGTTGDACGLGGSSGTLRVGRVPCWPSGFQEQTRKVFVLQAAPLWGGPGAVGGGGAALLLTPREQQEDLEEAKPT